MRKTIWLAFVTAVSCQNSSENEKADENSSSVAGQARRLVGGKNVDASREDERLKDRIEGLEKAARSRGWNIAKDFLISTADYARFLDRLLADGRVVETRGVRVDVSNNFKFYEGRGYVDIDHGASIDEVINYLTE